MKKLDGDTDKLTLVLSENVFRYENKWMSPPTCGY